MEVQTGFLNSNVTKEFLDNACIYACGSLAREEICNTSDLDLFFLHKSAEDITKLNEVCFFSKLFEINIKLGYTKPSKEGEYWKFHKIDELLDIGSQKEDFNNCFTSRLLLLLESRPIYNDELYEDVLNQVINAYFLEYYKYEKTFLPMFLINDILRYWYTLTLNYEFRRNNQDTNHKKYWKRLKLKYSRLLTCFSAIACLYELGMSPQHAISILKTTPLKRLDIIMDANKKLSGLILNIKKEYDWFLSLTNFDPNWWDKNHNKVLAFENADKFHDLVVHKLIDEISKKNKTLKFKLDI
jgi:predicted nucleotidyltransferase